MRVYLGQPPAEGIGGISRVTQQLYKYLPLYDVEIVSSIEEADIAHAQIAVYKDYPTDIPLVVSSHGLMWHEDGWGRVGWKINKLCVESYIKADVVTAPSEFVAKAIARNTLVPATVVRHGIDPQDWLPAESKGYVLWNKSRADPACDPSVVNALAELAGDIEFISTFGKESSNVNIIGTVPHSEMKKYIRHAGVYLITPRESGGPSFGVLEAMSCGVPVLSWDYGGTAEAIIHKETGYLASYGDYKDLLKGLHYCLQHRERLGENARRVVIEKYDAKNTTAQYVDVYKKAVFPSGPKVSVIVPCYNLGKFLPQCVSSVQNQSLKDWELIIIDDASTDDSGAIADSFDDPRIKVLHNKTNLHVSDTRNKGIFNAKGKYILPLDADDRLFPDALQELVKELDTNRDIQIVSGKLYLYSEHDLANGRQGAWPDDTDYTKQINGFNRLPYCSLYRKKVWKNTGGYRRRIKTGVEDADFWTRALSFGYKAKIIDTPILKYTMRSNSLGKVNKNGAQEWLAWFPWSKNAAMTPLAALDGELHTTLSYDSLVVSIIVPVGPGHAHHIQTVVDSIIAQTIRNWEIILINDTGEEWGEDFLFTMGTSFVRHINSKDNHGVAWARNKGVELAKAKHVVFLDVDDVAEPHMLEVLLKAHDAAGGWIYGDWYKSDGNSKSYEEAKDWNFNAIIKQSLAPITGLYEKKHVLEVGGFDESLPGWEDWDFHLKLIEKGICGTRVKYPLITYNMHLGNRREENFSNRENLLKYIVNRHTALYDRTQNMGCRSCGGKRTLTVGQTTASSESEQMSDLIKIQYIGPEIQTRTFKSRFHKGTRYRISANKPTYVFKEDAEWLLALKYFERVKEEPITTASVEVVETEQEVQEEKDTSLTTLNLRPETIAVLGSHFNSVEDILAASDAELLSIKGIGKSRLEKIRMAAIEWMQ